MASTPERGSSIKDYNLDELYQQLRELELSDQQLKTQVRELNFYQRRLRYRDAEESTLTEGSATAGLRNFLDAQSTTLSDCQKLLARFRHTLMKDINVCSRPFLRPLTILDMPDEILITVFEYVKSWEPSVRYPTYMYCFGVGEIKNLRLTCRRFCDTSSHLLLPLARIELNSTSVDRFDAISHHPTISKGVRAVRVVLDYYCDELANDFALFAEYSAVNLRDRTDIFESIALNRSDGPSESDTECIRKAREFETSWMSFASGAFSDSTFKADSGHQNLLQRAYEEYQSRAANQKQICENPDFVRSVATAIGRMPLASRLEFREFDTDSIRRRRRTGIATLREGDEDWFLWQMLIPMMWDEGRQWGLGTPHSDLLVDLPRAIHEAGIELQGLDYHISSLPESHIVLTAEEIRSVSMAVQHVKHLTFELQGYRLADSEHPLDPADLKYLHGYIDAISNTNSIEGISLDLSVFSGRNTPPLTDLGSLMSFRLWENLKKVTWHSTPVHQADVKRFFLQLQKPLQFLYLSGVHLLSGSWAETLDILRAAPTGYYVSLSHPQGAECEDLGVEEKARVFDSPNDQYWRKSRAEKYIMGYCKHNPLKPAEDDQSDTSSTY